MDSPSSSIAGAPSQSVTSPSAANPQAADSTSAGTTSSADSPSSSSNSTPAAGSPGTSLDELDVHSASPSSISPSSPVPSDVPSAPSASPSESAVASEECWTGHEKETIHECESKREAEEAESSGMIDDWWEYTLFLLTTHSYSLSVSSPALGTTAVESLRLLEFPDIPCFAIRGVARVPGEEIVDPEVVSQSGKQSSRVGEGKHAGAEMGDARIQYLSCSPCRGSSAIGVVFGRASYGGYTYRQDVARGVGALSFRRWTGSPESPTPLMDATQTSRRLGMHGAHANPCERVVRDQTLRWRILATPSR
ncbi:hypothetical protein NMY22_g19646 [Coprinellus aureogranulatus]|nr:hypothetical protein NMY22_g19646 [Coprinellus aureogranulatus]